MKIGIVGCGGRMGRMLLEQVIRTGGCELGGATEWEGSELIGKDAGLLIGGETIGVQVSSDPRMLFKLSDAVIDFTAPAATVNHATLAAESGTALVIGTTGLKPDQQKMVGYAASKAAIVQAPNMSVGVNLLFALVEKVSSILDETYDIEIVEMHHRHKVDAPSGTALGLGRAAAKGRDVALDDTGRMSREGQTGARPAGEIGFATLRGGDVVGDHTVIYATEGERIELTHKASDRSVFAKGAVRAAIWCEDRKPGLYSMHDVLGI